VLNSIFSCFQDIGLRIGVTTLTCWGHVTIRFPIGHFLLVVLWNGVSLSQVVCEIMGSKRIGVMSLTTSYRSRDRPIPHRSFPIGGPLEPSLYMYL